MRVGWLVEAATHLVLAVTTNSLVVFATMTLFGAHAVIWGTVATTVRQRSVPDALLGRVTRDTFPFDCSQPVRRTPPDCQGSSADPDPVSPTSDVIHAGPENP